MNILSSLLVALGLSMDNWAVTIASGCSHHDAIPKSYIFKVSSLFAAAHFVMFSGGWLCGAGLGKYIGAVDHWIAFGLLAVIGINMIRESRGNEQESANDDFSARAMVPLAVATSIDALAVGVSFAFLQVNIVPAVSFIGVTTFVCCVVGVRVGNLFGNKYQSRAELFGGIVLVLMGLKILLEHLLG